MSERIVIDLLEIQDKDEEYEEMLEILYAVSFLCPIY